MSESKNLKEMFKQQGAQGVWTPRRQLCGMGYPAPSNPDALVKGYDSLRTPSPGGFVTHYCPDNLRNKDMVTPLDHNDQGFNSPVLVKGVKINSATPAPNSLASSTTGSHMWTDVSLGGSGYKPGLASQETDTVVPLSLDFSNDSPIRPSMLETPPHDMDDDLSRFKDDCDTTIAWKKRKAHDDDSSCPATPDLKKFKAMTKANLEVNPVESSETKEALRQNVLDFFQKTQLKHDNLNNGSAFEGLIKKPSDSDGDSAQ